MTCVNIGAGATHIPGFRNVDIAPWADITLDIGRERLPFDDSSVDVVFSYHTLEHVDDYLFALGEIHRVLRHGALLLVGVPYVTSTKYNLVNPYHRHHFNEHSFAFFDSMKGTAVEENTIRFRKVFHRFHYMGGFRFVPPPFRGWARDHLFNVVRAIDFGLVAVKRAGQVEMPKARVVQARFDECLAARRPYEKAARRRVPTQDVG